MNNGCNKAPNIFNPELQMEQKGWSAEEHPASRGRRFPEPLGDRDRGVINAFRETFNSPEPDDNGDPVL